MIATCHCRMTLLRWLSGIRPCLFPLFQLCQALMNWRLSNCTFSSIRGKLFSKIEVPKFNAGGDGAEALLNHEILILDSAVIGWSRREVFGLCELVASGAFGRTCAIDGWVPPPSGGDRYSPDVGCA